MFDPQDLEPELLEQYQWGSDNRLQQAINPWGDLSRFSYDGDGNRIKMTVDVDKGPNGRGNGKGQGQGIGTDPSKCGDVVPPGFVPPGLAKKCGQGEEPYPDEHPGGPRDGWETQHKKKHWEFHYTNDISLALPEVLQVTEDDATKWKETFVYGAGMERISMTYLPAYDHDNGWEPSPGVGGADPDVTPKTLYYMTDIMGSTIGLLTQDGRLSARYHYDEFGMVLDSKKFDVNWPGPDNLYGYTGLEYDYYTDLNYARARYYKPEIGRFISEDTYKGTLGNTQSQNLYTYVYNNPLIYTDPSGHIVESADVFNINWLINEQKQIWHNAFENNNSVGMADAAREANRLRLENSHLRGLLNATDQLQNNEKLVYGKYIIEIEAYQVQLEVRVRIDQNNMVYYSLPSESELKSEEIYIQGKLAYYSSEAGKYVIERAMEAVEEFGGAQGKIVGTAYFSTLGGIDVAPIGQTITMAYFQQNGVNYNGIFTVENQEVIRFRGWRQYGSIFDFRVPKR